MKPVQTMPIGTTHCPGCGRPMHFVKSVPKLGALPELRTYVCKGCGITFTEAVEIRESAELADETTAASEPPRRRKSESRS
jgi:transposase-like protein